MNKRTIAGGIAVVVVALGFVCPQLAQIRMNGVLGPGGIALLFLGTAGTLGGLWCVFQGVRGPSTPAS